jgi:membrane-associated phospholipid phosphatase
VEKNMSAGAVIWSLIIITIAATSVLYPTQGMSVALDWSGTALYLLALYTLHKLTQRQYPVASRIAHTFMQIFVFNQAAAYLTYPAMAAAPFPLADAALSRADALLGFDWRAWFLWVQNHPIFHWALSVAYASIPLQLLVLVVCLAASDPDRLDELVLSAIIAIALTVPGMVLLPAVGAWTEHGIGLIEPWKHDILLLRVHELPVVTKTQGIISFPSFHTSSAVLLANMARNHKIFVPILLLNFVVVVSVMSEGAHYFVDMLSGLIVALVAIVITRQVLNRCHAMPSRAPLGATEGVAGSIGKPFVELPARQ